MRGEVDRARSAIAASGMRAAQSPDTVLSTDGRVELRYIPFEHVEVGARLAIVGITPGPDQIDAAYGAWQAAVKRGLTEAECLRAAKASGAFAGRMRTNLIRMLDRFRITEWLGVERGADLWGKQQHLLHSTSVVPHAAFLKGKMFAGSFDQVLRSEVLRQSFERDFLPEFEKLSLRTKIITLGPTPMDAVEWCVAQGIITEDRYLGPLCHPSGSSGSQVDYFLGEKARRDFTPGDPVLHRIPWLDLARIRMATGIGRLL